MNFASTSSLRAHATRQRASRLLGSAQNGRSRRRVHSLPRLDYPVENGLGNFLSPKALKTVAVDYQGGLLSRLNDLIKDTELESQSVTQIVLTTARTPSKVLTFNTASQALNNSFFLDMLAPPQTPNHSNEVKLDRRLAAVINHEFGSLGQLKSTFGAAAMGMSTSGWLWLAMDLHRRLAVVPTYGSGTILVRSRRQALPQGLEPSLEKASASVTSLTSEQPSHPHPGASLLDSSSTNPLSSTASSSSHSSFTPASPVSPLGGLGQTRPSSNLFTSDGEVAKSSFADHSILPDLNNVSVGFFPNNKTALHQFGDHLTPLFCVSVHEHAWLEDYGVWGKEEYIARFWDALNWRKVGDIHNAVISVTGA